jgi:hypothetical protein
MDGDLLLGIFYLLDSFGWGSGNGIALPPVLRTFQTSSILETVGRERIYTDYASKFEARVDSDKATIYTDGLEDIY